MIRSYLIAAWRSFGKNKVHTGINVVGLSLGIMTGILALMFVWDEISFDQFHSRKDRIFHLNKINTEDNGTQVKTGESSGMMGPTMVEEFPEVEKAVRFLPWFDDIVLSYQTVNVVTKAGEVAYADSTFFEVFDFPLLRGNPKTALKRPLTMVLTEGTAKALFGEEDALGKTVISVDGREFEITGIAAAPPHNSHIQFSALISWTTTVPRLGPVNMEWMNNWIAQGISTYLLLRDGKDAPALESKFPAFMKEHMPTRVDRYHLYLQPLGEMYLRSQDLVGLRTAKLGNLQFVYLFTFVAGFVLFIACINYINISTSKATRRAREVGMRKTMGAGKSQLVYQFLGESFLVTLLSTVLGVAMLYVMIPFFNQLAGKSLPMSLLLDKNLIGGVAMLVLVVGVSAGFYPAVVISSFAPAEVLHASAKSRLSGNWPRYVLITFQFTISIMMIAGTLIVYQQIRFILSKDLGFDKEHVMVVPFTDGLAQNGKVFQNKVNVMTGVSETSLGRTALGNGSASTFVIPEGFKPDEVEVRMFPTDGNFQKTYGLELATGRFFNTELSSDSDAFVINEALARRLQWTDPVGKMIRFDETSNPMPVIGVLKDFYFASLYDDVEPLVMWISARRPNALSIRFAGNPAQLLTSLESQWKQHEARYPFQYYFLDDQLARSYSSEEKLFETTVTFAGLSIFIACLGLYGLVSFTMEQRTKEFGIRKVLGASVASLNFLVNKKFIAMVFLGAALAVPVVVPLSARWLERFAFKIEMSASPFVIAVLITLLVTVVAVSVHAVRVALMNPATSLRHE